MSRVVRVGAVAGVLAAYVFLLGTIAISWLEEDFMDQLGWEVWPSGLALGPHGWLQTLNFVVFGALQIAFALAVAAIPAQRRAMTAAPVLLDLAGVGAVLLVFETDPPDVDETWHGLVHGLAYLTWLGSIVIAYPFTLVARATSCRLDARPKWPSVLAVLLFPPVLLLPDDESAGNYIFFAVVLTPLAVIALHLAVGAHRQRS